MKAGTILRSLLAGAFGLVLLAGLFALTDLSLKQFIGLIPRIKLWAFIGIVACSFVYVVLGAMKWHLIANVKPPRAFFYTHHTAQAMLIGQFLPPPVAVAVNRATVMKLKQGATLRKGILNALYDMGFDFLIAALLVPISLLQFFYRIDFGIWLLLGAVTLLGATFFLAQTKNFLPAWLRRKLGLEDEKQHLLSQRLIGLMMLLSAARLGIVIIRLAVGAYAFGLPVPFHTVAYIVPLSTMSALLAVTPANLGIAEWSWAYLLALWSVPVAVGAFYGVSFRILVFLAQLIVSVVCWVLYKIAKT